jgi:hypothetical protein
VRLINGFIARTRWDESAEGEDQKALTGLVTAGGENEVRDLLVKYLSLVRPMESFNAELIGCEKYENYGKLLFTDYERPWDGETL